MTAKDEKVIPSQSSWRFGACNCMRELPGATAVLDDTHNNQAAPGRTKRLFHYAATASSTGLPPASVPYEMTACGFQQRRAFVHCEDGRLQRDLSSGHLDHVHQPKEKVTLDLEEVNVVSSEKVGEDLQIQRGCPKAEETHADRRRLDKWILRQQSTKALHDHAHLRSRGIVAKAQEMMKPELVA